MVKEIKELNSKFLSLQKEISDFIKENKLEGLSETRSIKGAFNSIQDKLKLSKHKLESRNLASYSFDREIILIEDNLLSILSKPYLDKDKKSEIKAFLAKLDKISKIFS